MRISNGVQLIAPASSASIGIIADYFEYLAITSPRMEASFESMKRIIMRGADSTYPSGIDDDDDAFDGRKAELFIELNQRLKLFFGKYPFIVDSTTELIQINRRVINSYRFIYYFLLLSTRLNMRDNRRLANIDAGELFERVCQNIMQNYFGEHSKVWQFNSGGGGFATKLDRILKSIGEPQLYKNKYSVSNARPVDDGIDLIVCVPFKDDRLSRFIAFVQCKTGENWQPSIGRMDPFSFNASWIDPGLSVAPISVHCVSEAVLLGNWSLLATRARLLFDRARIIEFYRPSKSKKLASEMRKWISVALGTRCYKRHV